MKVLIIGLGSIARKHIKELRKLIVNIQIIALRSQINSINSDDVQNIYSWTDIPKDIDFIIISNPTSKHYDTIKNALKLKVPLFIEKPPLSELKNINYLQKIINENKIKTYVAFNLRFHPVIEWLKENLKLDNVREVQIYCGSYLPDWRPGTDYRKCYSAIQELGGGVHLDLIHELDYTRFLFGEPIHIRAEKNTKSKLEINSIDFANYLLEYSYYYINITLNYYRRNPKRSIEIILNDEIYYADLINCKVINSNGYILMEIDNYNLEETYKNQLKYFIYKVLYNESYMNNFEESIKTLKLCLA